MQIIPEQISLLRQREQELIQKYLEYKDYIQNREITGCEETAISQIGDIIIEGQYQRDLEELREVRALLQKEDYVSERHLDQIGIGTKFIIRFTNEEESCTAILADASYGLNHLYQYISSKSPVGKSIVGKKIGESFQAVTTDEHGQLRVISEGIVEDIITNPKAYTHFIREKDFRYRRSKLDKEIYKKVQTLPAKEKAVRLAERFAITESQREILLIEKERLLNRKYDINTKRRLAYIDKVLRTANIAEPPTDGTIGIGSKFDVIIGEGDNSEIRQYELINRAVSDELDDTYVERISPFGEKFYGLKAGDQIKFKQNRKMQTATILNVYIPEKANYNPKTLRK